MPVNFYIMQPSSSYLNQYQTFQTSRVKPEDYVKRYSTELGVDDARSRVKSANAAIRSTQDTIAATPDSVAGRTSGSLVTDAQRNRLVQNEVNPLADILTTQNRDYTEATTDANKLTNDVDRRVALALQGDETQGTSLLTLYQAAFEQEKQAEAKRQFEAQLAEQRRQAAESNAIARASLSTPSASTGAGSGLAVWTNNGADNQFKNSAGKPISAFEYSVVNGVGYRELLSQMASKGDKNAQIALKYVGNDGQFGGADESARGALSAVGAKGTFKSPTTAKTNIQKYSPAIQSIATGMRTDGKIY